MKSKMLSMLSLLTIANIYSMENIEDKLKEVPELKDIMAKIPRDEFIESWKVATGKLAMLKSIAAVKVIDAKIALENKVPEELVDFCKKFQKLLIPMKLIFENQEISICDQKIVLNVMNDPEYINERMGDNRYAHLHAYLGISGKLSRQNFFDCLLILSTAIGNISLVSLALSLGADINAKDRYSENALIKAVSRNSKKIVKLLLNAGAEINARDYSGETALMISVRTGNIKIAFLLLDKYADVNIKNNEGSTALDIAQSINSRQDIIHLLQQSK